MSLLTFFKVQVASVTGSGVDYLVTIVLASGFHCWYLASSVVGNVAGAIVLFVLCRKWIFLRDKGSIHLQIIRFVLVFTGNIILASIGIYMLTHLLNFHYVISKTFMSVLLGVSYNYIMQKKFVFG